MSVPNIYPSYLTAGPNPAIELSGSASNPFPTGIIIMSGLASLTVPSGWLSCNGASVSKTTYANLYSVLGANAFGTDTSTDFFLPNFIDLFPIGVSGTKALNSTGGATNHVHGNVAITNTISTESIDHDHDTSNASTNHFHSNSNVPNQPGAGGESSHNHGINGASTAGATSNTNANTGSGTTSVGSHTHGINAPSTNGGGNAAHNWSGMSTGNIAGGSTGHNHTITGNSVTSHSHTGSHPTAATSSGANIPPYLVIQFIIKT